MTTQTQAQAPTVIEAPNLFVVHGEGIHVTYSASSFSGKPQFTYQDAHTTRTFQGDEIDVNSGPLGTLVTVVLTQAPDVGETSFSLVLPLVNLVGGSSVSIDTIGVTTTKRTSIGGPAIVRGQLTSYRVHCLRGDASQVEF
jgi:hypothetical protein